MVSLCGGSLGEPLQNSGRVKCSSFSRLFGQIAHKENTFMEDKLIFPPLTYKQDMLHM